MRRTDLISGVVLLGLAPLIGAEARRLSYWAGPHIPGPGFLPFWLAVGLALGALGVLVEGRRSPVQGVAWFPSRDARSRVLLLILFTTVLVFAIWPVGMLVAIGLYLLIFLSIFMPGRWVIILAMPVATPLAVYLIFERWLKVPLPQGFFGF